MNEKKLSSYGWWAVVKTALKYGAYIMIIFDGISSIIKAIETKDGTHKETENV